MNALKAIFLSGTILFAVGVNAATSRFEVQTPYSSTPYQFPGLDLTNVENIKLRTSNSNSDPGYNIDRMEIVFPNANNLVINNIKQTQSGRSFYGIVNNGWVFRKLLVDIDIPSANLVSGSDISVRLHVANTVDFNNNFAEPPQGEVLLDVSGTIINVTPNKVADTHWMRFNNKGLNLRLYQRAENNLTASDSGSGFKLYMNWMGHGERTVYLDAPFQPHEYDNFRAIALNVTPNTGPEGENFFLEVEYEDETGMRQFASAGDIQSILNQAYQLQ